MHVTPTLARTPTSTEAPSAGRYDRALLAAAWLCFPIGLLVSNGLDPSLFAEPFLVLALLVLLAPHLALARWPRPWLMLAAAVPLVLLGAMALLSELGETVLPADAYSFVSYLALAQAMQLALAAGVAGFVAARRGAGAEPARRHAVAGALSLVLLGAALTSVLAASVEGARAPGYDFAPDARVHVVIEDADHEAFTPAALALEAGVVTEIVVENRHSGQHSFVYEHGGETHRHVVLGGATARFLVRFDAPGEVPFWCEAHASADRAEGQVGVMHVAAPPSED